MFVMDPLAVCTGSAVTDCKYNIRLAVQWFRCSLRPLRQFDKKALCTIFIDL